MPSRFTSIFPKYSWSALQRKFFGWLVLWVPLLILSGCETLPQKPSDLTLQQQQLLQVKKWKAEGKLSLTFQSERHSASFNWSQLEENFSIHLFGPFGQGATWLRHDGGMFTLENAQTGMRYAPTAEELMQEVLGWQVPVSNLQFWLRGLPAPTPRATNTTFDASGLLTQLQQQRWIVTYSGHQEFTGWWLPTRISAKRDDIEIKIVVKSWQLNIDL